MKDKQWAGRFSGQMDLAMEDFNSSVHFDKRLFKHDIDVNIAWAGALLSAKVLTKTEHSQITSALKKIKEDIASGKAAIKKEHEDIHMNIEVLLTQKTGEAGKKIHTGKSRNDQVVTDIRLYMKEEISFILELVKSFQKTLLHLADKNLDVIMPGYTHTQRAQPVLFSHYLMAHFEMLGRDRQRLKQCLERSDIMSLGSAALGGSSYPIDRWALAKELGFKDISRNSIDAVSDRDFVAEFLADAAILMMHISRLAEEMVLWSSSEFKFIELADAYSTGSSIMPQKKNPDVAELSRGKTGRVYGDLFSVLTMLKGLPLSYNRDMQEDKEPLFDSIDTVKTVLLIMQKMVSTMKINEDNMKAAVETGWLTATDLADYIVEKGVPFRKAHEIVGKIVRYCVDNNKELYALSKKEFALYCDRIGQDVYDFITPESSINDKDIEGGTARSRVRSAIRLAKKELK
ncbi:MAG: argininosuccinate lyase [Candidatus Margulisiibacteriota bacterium]